MTGSDVEKALRARAVHEAAELYRSHGDAASGLLVERSLDPAATAEDHRRYRLAQFEIERLDRERRYGSSSRAIVVWKPPLLSLARLAAFFERAWRR